MGSAVWHILADRYGSTPGLFQLQYVFPIVIIVEPALLLQQQSVQPNQKQEGQTKLRLQGSCTKSVLAGMAEGSTKIGGALWVVLGFMRTFSWETKCKNRDQVFDVICYQILVILPTLVSGSGINYNYSRLPKRCRAGNKHSSCKIWINWWWEIWQICKCLCNEKNWKFRIIKRRVYINSGV